MKKRFANHVENKKEVIEVEHKLLHIEEERFRGDVYLNVLVKSEKEYVSDENICVCSNQYKWLQFYDYSSKVCLTTIYDDKNEIVEWYFDIAKKIGKENGIPYEEDLYLDVVVKADFEIVLLDEYELQEAFDKSEITKEEFEDAYKTARDLMKKLSGNVEKLKEFTDGYLGEML